MKYGDHIQKDRKLENTIVIIFILLFSIIVVRCAWLGDDAYITFRVCDNFVNGYGLTWNTAERVQVYTHPLWMFLITSIYFFIRNIYYVSLFISIALSILAVSIYSFKLVRFKFSAVLGIIILIFSKAFIDYSTSGLENPLIHLLLVLFCYFYLQQRPSIKSFFFLSLITALSAFTRMDTILLFLPALCFTFMKLKQPVKSLKTLLFGFSPFILWELFSLFYYGFPFPNTAYAKLNTGIPAISLIRQGLYYLKDSLIIDPVTLFVITSAIVMVIVKRKWNYLPLSIGIVLYHIYIVKIGGCFMSGRYFTAPLLCSVIILTHQGLNSVFKRRKIFVILIFLFGLISPRAPILSSIDYGINFDVWYPHNIADERAYYYPETGLMRVISDRTPDPSDSPTKTLKLDNIYTVDRVRKLSPEIVSLPLLERTKAAGFELQMVIGRLGFSEGPKVHILDIVALADPLLSRLPAKSKDRFWIGHFKRRVPGGYTETLKTGINKIHDPKLSLFYDKLSLITRGNLFDLNRLIEIIKMNVGMYDHLAVDNFIPPKLQHVVPIVVEEEIPVLEEGSLQQKPKILLDD